MSAILQLIEAANAESERLRHIAQTTKQRPLKRIYEREAERWGKLAADARAELATILPPNITGS